MLETGNSVETMNHKSYMVRIWRSSSQSPWRVSVRVTQTGEQFQFARLENLFLFLSEETADDPETKR
jgi:hypothetical protein